MRRARANFSSNLPLQWTRIESAAPNGFGRCQIVMSRDLVLNLKLVKKGELLQRSHSFAVNHLVRSWRRGSAGTRRNARSLRVRLPRMCTTMSLSV